jgi:hypothetical protein
MTFWTDAQLEPKRQYRFVVNVSNVAGINFAVKKATKPEVEVSTAEHKYLNHTFYYPGSPTWSPVSLTFANLQNPEVSMNFARILTTSGYIIPTGPGGNFGDLTTISKAAAVFTLGSVNITQIDSLGNPVENWDLRNAFITKINWGGELEYGNDEITECTIDLRYDWAQIQTANASSGLSVANADTAFKPGDAL